MSTIRTWLDAATPRERARLAKLAGTSVGRLRHLAGNYRRANIKAENAVKLERASAKLARSGLPIIRREDLAVACRSCEFARKCRGQANA